MNYAVLSYFVLALLFAVYGVLCSLEAGIALVRFFPKLSSNAAKRQQAFTPLWEITNVFLVFGFTGFAVLFNSAITQVSNAVLPILSVGMIALLARAALVMYLYYSKTKVGANWLNGLFLLVSYTVPLTFIGAGIHLLGGMPFWQTSSGWTLEAIGLLGITATALAYQAAFSKGTVPKRTRWLELVVALLWLALVGFLVPTAFMHDNSFMHLVNIPLVLVVAGIDLAMLCYVMLFAQKKEHYNWLVATAVSLVLPLAFAWLHMPHLLFDTVSIQDGFGGDAYALAVVIALVASLPIWVLGFYLFVKLYQPAKN